MISPGQKLDLSFRLKVVRDGVAKEMAFVDLLTRRTIVSVYMKNRTPTCDRQTASLARRAAEFDRAGYNLVAVSRDSCGSHARIQAANSLPYALASDPQDRFAQATKSLVQKSMYGRTFTGPARAAYVLDRDGTVLAVIDPVDRDDHAAQLEKVIARL